MSSNRSIDVSGSRYEMCIKDNDLIISMTRIKSGKKYSCIITEEHIKKYRLINSIKMLRDLLYNSLLDKHYETKNESEYHSISLLINRKSKKNNVNIMLLLRFCDIYDNICFVLNKIFPQISDKTTDPAKNIIVINKITDYEEKLENHDRQISDLEKMITMMRSEIDLLKNITNTNNTTNTTNTDNTFETDLEKMIIKTNGDIDLFKNTTDTTNTTNTTNAINTTDTSDIDSEYMVDFDFPKNMWGRNMDEKGFIDIRKITRISVCDHAKNTIMFAIEDKQGVICRNIRPATSVLNLDFFEKLNKYSGEIEMRGTYLLNLIKNCKKIKKIALLYLKEFVDITTVRNFHELEEITIIKCPNLQNLYILNICKSLKRINISEKDRKGTEFNNNLIVNS